MSEKETNEAASVPRPVDALVGLKSRVSEILHEALRGYDMSQRYRNEQGFIRWGIVEKDIHEAIDAANARVSGVKRTEHWMVGKEVNHG